MKVLNNSCFRLVLVLSAILFAVSVSAAEEVWIDVRSIEEYNKEHLEGVVHIPHTEVADKIASLNLEKNTPIRLHCRSGGRAGIAQKSLEKMGYTDVVNVGGMDDAKKLMAKSADK
ncbi:hypothetical protein NBRC116493_01180 [Aurantivibrio infirmus]